MTPELFGYADPLRARPGQRVRVMINDDRPGDYEAALVRLFAPDFGPAAPPPREMLIEHPVNGTYSGNRQSTLIGSYGVIDTPLTMGRGHGFTVSAWVQSTLETPARQAIISLSGEAAGYSVSLVEGELVLAVRTGEATTLVGSGLTLDRHAWYLLAAGIDRRRGIVSFQLHPWTARSGFAAEQRTEARHPNLPALQSVRVMLAAEPSSAGVSCHFNGKLEAPRIYAGQPAVRDLGEDGSSHSDMLAAWDLGPPTDSPVFRDQGPQQLHGRLINCPARAVTGRRWDGTVFDFRFAPDHYGAVHFHEDDLADANWTPSLEFELPETLASGVYAIRLARAGVIHSYVPFFVTAAVGRRAGAAVLMSTATYMAYGNHVTRLSATRAERVSGGVNVVEDSDLVLLDHPELGCSTYDNHRDGSGVVYVTRLRPMLNMKPSGRAWNMALDMRLVDWLDQQGIEVDIVTDEDLHAHGAAALSGYRLVMTGCHPEYVSTAMLDALETFTGDGGRLMYLGGNGFYWRVAFNDAFPGVLEVRRGKEGTRLWSGAVGEDHQSFNGEAGGTWRSLGRPPNALFGVGYVGQGFDCASPYRRTPESRDPRVSFMFDGVGAEVFGSAGIVPGGAAGLEIDAANPALATPGHTLVVARSFGHSNAYVPSVDEIEVNYASADATTNPSVRAEISFHETANGGAVFSTGSIAYLGALGLGDGNDPLDRVTLNVVRRFLDPAPFPDIPHRRRAGSGDLGPV